MHEVENQVPNPEQAGEVLAQLIQQTFPEVGFFPHFAVLLQRLPIETLQILSEMVKHPEDHLALGLALEELNNQTLAETVPIESVVFVHPNYEVICAQTRIVEPNPMTRDLVEVMAAAHKCFFKIWNLKGVLQSWEVFNQKNVESAQQMSSETALVLSQWLHKRLSQE